METESFTPNKEFTISEGLCMQDCKSIIRLYFMISIKIVLI